MVQRIQRAGRRGRGVLVWPSGVGWAAFADIDGFGHGRGEVAVSEREALHLLLTVKVEQVHHRSLKDLHLLPTVVRLKGLELGQALEQVDEPDPVEGLVRLVDHRSLIEVGLPCLIDCPLFLGDAHLEVLDLLDVGGAVELGLGLVELELEVFEVLDGRIEAVFEAADLGPVGVAEDLAVAERSLDLGLDPGLQLGVGVHEIDELALEQLLDLGHPARQLLVLVGGGGGVEEPGVEEAVGLLGQLEERLDILVLDGAPVPEVVGQLLVEASCRLESAEQDAVCSPRLERLLHTK